MEVYEKVKIIFQDVLQCEEYDLYPEARIVEDLLITERVAYEIYSSLKEAFQVEATKEEALQLVTFQDAVDLVAKKLEQKEEE